MQEENAGSAEGTVPPPLLSTDKVPASNAGEALQTVKITQKEPLVQLGGLVETVESHVTPVDAASWGALHVSAPHPSAHVPAAAPAAAPAAVPLPSAMFPALSASVHAPLPLSAAVPPPAEPLLPPLAQTLQSLATPSASAQDAGLLADAPSLPPPSGSLSQGMAVTVPLDAFCGAPQPPLLQKDNRDHVASSARAEGPGAANGVAGDESVPSVARVSLCEHCVLSAMLSLLQASCCLSRRSWQPAEMSERASRRKVCCAVACDIALNCKCESKMRAPACAPPFFYLLTLTSEAVPCKLFAIDDLFTGRYSPLNTAELGLFILVRQPGILLPMLKGFATWLEPLQQSY